jgi:hypothetical protein
MHHQQKPQQDTELSNDEFNKGYGSGGPLVAIKKEPGFYKVGGKQQTLLRSPLGSSSLKEGSGKESKLRS